MTGFSAVILSRRSRAAAGEAAQDGRRTPSLLTREGGGKVHMNPLPTLQASGGPSTVLRRSGFASAPAAAQDDSACR
jgi:hypothetical protein